MKGKKKYENSETIVIKRSQINLNPFNPKVHRDEDIKKQVKNIRKNGYLGGIVYNEQTGNCVDGHRRILAMDIIYKYDGTPETDYDIKVEKVNFDKKTELEQLSYMALANSKADYNLVAKYINDIDFHEAGISDEDYAKIRDLGVLDAPERGMDSMDDAFLTPMQEDEEYTPVTELDDTDTKTNAEVAEEIENKPHMTKEEVKAEKAKQDKVASDRQSEQDLYIFLKVDDYEDKAIFCELLGVTPTNSMMINLKDVLRLID